MPKNTVGESFTVALISGSGKFYGQQGRGKYQDFPSKSFCVTVPKNFGEESFTVAGLSGTGNVWIGRGVSRFSVEKFLSDSPESLRRESFTVASFSSSEKRKSLDRRGEYPYFLSKIFCLRVPKFLVEESFTVALISGSEKV